MNFANNENNGDSGSDLSLVQHTVQTEQTAGPPSATASTPTETGTVENDDGNANLLMPEQVISETKGPIQFSVSNAQMSPDSRRPLSNNRPARNVGFSEMDLTKQVARRVKLGQVEFPSAANLGDILAQYTSDDIIGQIPAAESNFSFYRYFRTNFTVEVVATNCPFSPAVAMLVYIPNVAMFPRKPPGQTYSLEELTHLMLFPHKIIKFHVLTTANLHGPFMNIERYAAGDSRYSIGTFQLLVWNEMTANTTISITIFGSLINTSARFYVAPPAAPVTARDRAIAALLAKTRTSAQLCEELLGLGYDEDQVLKLMPAHTAGDDDTDSSQVSETPMGENTADVDRKIDTTIEPATLPRTKEAHLGGTKQPPMSGWNKHNYSDVAQCLQRPALLFEAPATKFLQGGTVELMKINIIDIPKLFRTSVIYLFYSGSVRISYVSTANYTTPCYLRFGIGGTFTVMHLATNPKGSVEIPWWADMPANTFKKMPVGGIVFSIDLIGPKEIPEDLHIQFYLRAGDDFRYQHPQPADAGLTWALAFQNFSDPDSYSFTPDGTAPPPEARTAGLDDVISDTIGVAESLGPLLDVGAKLFGAFHVPPKPVGDEWTNITSAKPVQRLSMQKGEFVGVDETLSQFTDNAAFGNVVGYCQQPARIHVIPFSTTDTQGKLLFTTSVAPSTHPFFRMVPLMFSYWRGSMKFTLEVIKAVNAKGMLVALVHPEAETPTAGNWHNYTSTVIDISQKESTIVDIPFTYTRDYIDITHTELSLSVMVVNPPNVCLTPGSTRVDVNVYVAFGEDFQLLFAPAQNHVIHLATKPASKAALTIRPGCSDTFQAGGDLRGFVDVALTPMSKVPLNCCDTRVPLVMDDTLDTKLPPDDELSFINQRHEVDAEGEFVHCHGPIRCVKVYFKDASGKARRLASYFRSELHIEAKHLYMGELPAYRPDMEAPMDRRIRVKGDNYGKSVFMMELGTLYEARVTRFDNFHLKERMWALIGPQTCGLFDKFLKPKVEGVTKQISESLDKIKTQIKDEVAGKMLSFLIVKLPAYALQMKSASSATDYISMALHFVGDLIMTTSAYDLLSELFVKLKDAIPTVVGKLFKTETRGDEDAEAEDTQSDDSDGFLKHYAKWLLNFLKDMMGSVSEKLPSFTTFFDWCKSFVVIGGAIRAAGTIFGILKAIVLAIAHAFWHKQTDLEKLVAYLQDSAHRNQIERMISYTGTSVHAVAKSPEALLEVQALREYAKQISPCLRALNSFEGRADSFRVMNFLSWAQSVIVSAPKIEQFEPVFILLEGEPGVGKTLEGLKLGNLLCQKMGFNGAPYQMFLQNEHHTGYYGQPVIFMDDLFQDPEGKDVYELTQLISSSPFAMTQADLASKGQQSSAYFVIGTTNNSTVKADWARTPKAVMRRFAATNYQVKKSDTGEVEFYPIVALSGGTRGPAQTPLSFTKMATEVLKHFNQKWTKHLEMQSSPLPEVAVHMPESFREVIAKSGVNRIAAVGSREQISETSFLPAFVAGDSDDPADAMSYVTWLNQLQLGAASCLDSSVTLDTVCREYGLSYHEPYDKWCRVLAGKYRMPSEISWYSYIGVYPYTLTKDGPIDPGTTRPMDQITFLTTWSAYKTSIEYSHHTAERISLAIKIIRQACPQFPYLYLLKKDESAFAQRVRKACHQASVITVLLKGLALAAGLVASYAVGNALWNAGTRLYDGWKRTEPAEFDGTYETTGRVRKKQPLAVKEESKPKEASTKGLDDRMPHVRKNLIGWTLLQLGNDRVESTHVNALCIGGGFVVVPAHACRMGQSAIATFDFQNAGEKSIEVPLTHNNVAQMAQGDRDADLCVVYLGVGCPSKRDISSYFISDTQYQMIKNAVVIGTIRSPKTGEIREVSGTVSWAEGAHITDKKGAFYQDCFESNIPINNGNCGSPIQLVSPRFEGAIVGLANASNYAYSYWVPITREIIAAAKDYLSSRAAAVPCQMGITTCGALSEEPVLPEARELGQRQIAEAQEAPLIQKVAEYPKPNSQCIVVPRCDETPYVSPKSNPYEHVKEYEIMAPTDFHCIEARLPAIPPLGPPEVVAPDTVHLDGSILVHQNQSFKMDPTRYEEMIYLVGQFLEEHIGECRTLTYKEVVNGFCELDGQQIEANGLNKQAVVGRVVQEEFGIKKRSEMLIQESDGSSTFKPEIQDWLYQLEYGIAHGKDFRDVILASHKQELRPRSKVMLGKQRVFLVAGAHTCALLSRYIGHFVAKFRSKGMTLKHTLGLDPVCCWDALAKSIGFSYSFGNAIAADVSNWDRNVAPMLMEAARRIIEKFYPKNMGARQIRLMLLNSCTWSVGVMGKLKMVMTGQKSGIFATTELNTLMHLCVFASAIIEMYSKVPGSILDHFKMVPFYCHGDDSIMGEAPNIEPHEQVAAVLKAYDDAGMVVTSADKKDSRKLKLSSADDVTYLKRRFKFDRNRFYPQMDATTMRGLLTYYKKGLPFEDNVLAALGFARQGHDIWWFHFIATIGLILGDLTPEDIRTCRSLYASPVWDEWRYDKLSPKLVTTFASRVGEGTGVALKMFQHGLAEDVLSWLPFLEMHDIKAFTDYAGYRNAWDLFTDICYRRMYNHSFSWYSALDVIMLLVGLVELQGVPALSSSYLIDESDFADVRRFLKDDRDPGADVRDFATRNLSMMHSKILRLMLKFYDTHPRCLPELTQGCYHPEMVLPDCEDVRGVPKNVVPVRLTCAGRIIALIRGLKQTEFDPPYWDEPVMDLANAVSMEWFEDDVGHWHVQY